MQKTQELAEPEYMLSAEVMQLARISRRTLDRWVADGTLPFDQVTPRSIRRYRRDDVLSVLRGGGAA